MVNYHILIKIAKKAPHGLQRSMPTGAYYDSEKGYWKMADKSLVSYQSPFGALVSKKCDVETGEDQKGE